MKRYANYLILAGMILSLGVGTFAITRLLLAYEEYQQGDKVYEELQNFADEAGPEKNADEPDSQMTEEPPDDFQFLQVDFEELQAINPDVTAWIQIPALDISYPVVRGTDNSYYLSHLFNGEANINGSIFMDYHSQPDFTGQNTIIYGHNMKNGSMFGTLEQYQDENLYRQYPSFYLYIPGYRLEYQIFSCYTARAGSAGYTYSFPEQEDFATFLETVTSYALYDTGITAGPADKIVSLSTCVNTSREHRFLVHGKLMNQTAIGTKE